MIHIMIKKQLKTKLKQIHRKLEDCQNWLVLFQPSPTESRLYLQFKSLNIAISHFGSTIWIFWIFNQSIPHLIFLAKSAKYVSSICLHLSSSISYLREFAVPNVNPWIQMVLKFIYKYIITTHVTVLYCSFVLHSFQMLFSLQRRWLTKEKLLLLPL